MDNFLLVWLFFLGVTVGFAITHMGHTLWTRSRKCPVCGGKTVDYWKTVKVGEEREHMKINVRGCIKCKWDETVEVPSQEK